MKKSHILGIILIAVAIGAIFASLSDASTYATFTQAKQNEGKEFHVVGKLDKAKDMTYAPEKDPKTAMQRLMRAIILNRRWVPWI